MAKAVCVLRSEPPAVVCGTVYLTQALQAGSPTRVMGRVSGLAPHARRGLRVLLFGDESVPHFRNLGGVFNPLMRPHALPRAREGGDEDFDLAGEERPAGALGNIVADAEGVSTFDFLDHLLHLVGPLSVIGRSLGITRDEDRGSDTQLASAPSEPGPLPSCDGGAGPIIAAGVIGIAALQPVPFEPPLDEAGGLPMGGHAITSALGEVVPAAAPIAALSPVAAVASDAAAAAAAAAAVDAEVLL